MIYIFIIILKMDFDSGSNYNPIQTNLITYEDIFELFN